MKNLFNNAIMLVKGLLLLIGISTLFGVSAGVTYGVIKQTFLFSAKLFL